MPSDHSAIHFTSIIQRPDRKKLTKDYRALKDIDSVAFKASIQSFVSSIPETESVTEANQLADAYNFHLTSVMNEHAPLRKKTSIDKPRAEWFSADLLSERRAVRKLERQWLTSKLEIHRQMFRSALKAYNRKLEETKSAFHRNRIETADQKELFRIVDNISESKKSSAVILPNDVEVSELSKSFADFFTEKIVKIRAALVNGTPYDDLGVSHQCELSTLDLMSVDEIRCIVSKMPSKSCDLDPMPTQFVKDYIDDLAPILLRIVNASFESGVFPASCKGAIVRPLIKKRGLDPNALVNYRPVSNCSFLSKFLEKCGFSRLHEYLSSNSLYGKFQSAYREGHSTETALLRVLNDVVLALDRQHDVILVLLDLSAAFDTIDHHILLDRLRSRFGICGRAHDWIESFLCGRTQKVSVRSVVSEDHALEFGVPQGSVLGPVLFSLYMTPVEDIITRHGLNAVIYADDTQIYVACDSRTDIATIGRVEACVDEIRHWTRANLLALNDGKTEIIRFSSRSKGAGFQVISGDVKVGDVVISPSTSVRDLGVMLDSAGLMVDQIINVCARAPHSLWRIGKICHC
jgi:hypothetical protein